MGIEDLTEVEVLYGIFNFLFVSLLISIGIRIIIKYFSLKRKEFFFVGLTLIFFTSAYWSVFINFLLIIFFDLKLLPPISIFIENAFVPFSVICWSYAFGELVYPNYKKTFITLTLSFCIPYEVFLIIFTIINPDVIAIQVSTFYTQHGPIPTIFNISLIIVSFITVTIFTHVSMKSDNRIIRLRGKLLLIGVILIGTGMILDTIVLISLLTLSLTRLIFIAGAILYYFGFFYSEKA